MLTAIGRAAVQRLVLRATPLTVPRSQPFARVACRAFLTTQWARLPAQATASSTKAKTKAKTKTNKATAATAATIAKKPVANNPAAKKPKSQSPSVKKVKKVEELTPEQKTKVQLREARKTALLKEQPKALAISAWAVYLKEQSKGTFVESERRSEAFKKLAQSYKDISSSERQRLAEIGQQNKLTNNATHKAWVESYSPQDIRNANVARMRIRRINGTPRKPQLIQDSRMPKRPSSAYNRFCGARWASGDYAGLRPGDVIRRMAEDYRKLSPSEAAVYHDLAKADRDRYDREMRTVLGRRIRSPRLKAPSDGQLS